MAFSKNEVIIIVPYNLFPIKLGGHKGIFHIYPFLAKYRTIHFVYPKTATNNQPPQTKNIIYKDFFGRSTMKRYFNLIAYYKICTYLLKNKSIQYIIVEHPYMWLPIFLVNIFTARKIILRTHNTEGLRFKDLGKWWWKLLFVYEKIAIKHSHLVTFVTQEDLLFAHKTFHIPLEKCLVLPYGCPHDKFEKQNTQASKIALRKEHNISAREQVFYFNGTLNYKPTLIAIERISNSILPALEKKGIKAKVLISGGSQPKHSVLENLHPSIIFCGFVPDIHLYYSGCDVFLNPVIEGGGIKTKLVEALSHNATCVSFKSGAHGINPEICHQKLLVVEDNNVDDFAMKVIDALKVKTTIGKKFFDFFYWGNSAKKLDNILNSL